MKHLPISEQKGNILLINPWIYDFAAYDFWIKPMGLLSVGRVLELFGYHVELIDCLDRFHPLNMLKHSNKSINKKYGTGKFHRDIIEKPEILSDIPRNYCRYGLEMSLFEHALNQISQPDIIMVTSMMTYWYPGPFKVIEIVHKKFPKIPVVLGGIYATLCYEHAKKYSGADYIIQGEGEEQALRLADLITGNRTDWDTFPKIWKEMPLIDFHQYKYLKSIPVITSKGCPYNCSFCACNTLSPRFEQRPVEAIFKYILYYYKKRNVRHLAYYDDALLVRKETHFQKLLEWIRKDNLHISQHTPNAIHAREITMELAELMFHTNFRTIRLSFESKSPERQKDMGNKVNDDILSYAIHCLEKAGYQRKMIDVYVLMGLPEQSIDEVIESMLYINALGARVRVNSFSPIPGTLEWERTIAACDFPKDADPLLSNNSIYPLRNHELTYDKFQCIRKLANVLNYELDQGIHLFNQSFISKYICKYMNKNVSVYYGSKKN